MAANELQGVRVVSFESRRSEEMAKLIQKRGGEAITAPSMREVVLPDQGAAVRFAEKLMTGGYDGLVMLSGGGTRKLFEAASRLVPLTELVGRLAQIWLICRGPKPVQVLKEYGLQATLVAPEPNTSQELLAELDARLSLDGKNLAVQEYGETNTELRTALEQRGAAADSILVYAWELPEDTGPLRHAVKVLVSGEAQVALFTSAQQVVHLFQIADQLNLGEALRAGLSQRVTVSVGPVTTAALKRHGIFPTTEPEHPKMGHLVSHLARNWASLSGNMEGKP